MPEVSLIWIEEAGLEGLDPAKAAKKAGVALSDGGLVEAAVVTTTEARAPRSLVNRLKGYPVKWLDLAAEVGGGPLALRQARAAAAVARAAGSAALGTMAQRYTRQPNQEVLVAGRGLAAVAAAHQAAALGHPVLLALETTRARAACADEKPAEVKRALAGLPAQVEVVTGTELVELLGAGGDFQARLQGPRRTSRRRFGAVVLAPPSAYAVPGDMPATAEDITLPVSRLKPKQYQGGEQWLQAAVIAPLGPGATAHGFARAVTAALALQKRPRVQVTLFLGEAKVASEGGERLYRDARRQGVLAMRVEPGGLRVSRDGRKLSFDDPVLGEPVDLRPDLVVLSEEVTGRAPAWLDNPLVTTAWDQDLPDHPRLQAGRTARSGLYLIGGARGAAPGDPRRAQAAAAAADLHGLLSGEAVAVPAVRDVLCASCLTCVRVCPHGVVCYAEDHIAPAPAACLACGVCTAECPAEAIAPPGWSNREMIASLAAGLKAAAGDKLVLFACRNSGMDAARALSLAGHQWPKGLLMVPVNCAGRVGVQLILRALSLGAGGVLVAGCHQGNCRSLNGNLRAKLRSGEAADLLAQVGGRPEQVRFMHLASNQPRALAQAVAELAQTAGEK